MAFHGGGEAGERPERDPQLHAVMWNTCIVRSTRHIPNRLLGLRILGFFFFFLPRSSVYYPVFICHGHHQQVISNESDTSGNNWGFTSYAFLYEEIMILYLKSLVIVVPLARVSQSVGYNFFSCLFCIFVFVYRTSLKAI